MTGTCKENGRGSDAKKDDGRKTAEENETNLMSQFIRFYFTSSMLNMFQTLIHTSSGAGDFSIVLPH